jgi:hypothetical protein
MGELWSMVWDIVKLSSYYGNKVRSVSVIVVNSFELELCGETFADFESKAEGISFG